MIYLLLKTVSTAIYTTVSTIWRIEELLINFMMFCFFLVLRLICHPIMVIPMLAGAAYMLHKIWMRRKAQAATEGGARMLIARSPRLHAFRGAGSLSTRGDVSEEERMVQA